MSYSNSPEGFIWPLRCFRCKGEKKNTTLIIITKLLNICIQLLLTMCNTQSKWFLWYDTFVKPWHYELSPSRKEEKMWKTVAALTIAFSPSKKRMLSYENMLSRLLREFNNRFDVFAQLEKDFALFRSPFTMNVSDVPEDLQIELIAYVRVCIHACAYFHVLHHKYLYVWNNISMWTGFLGD